MVCNRTLLGGRPCHPGAPRASKANLRASHTRCHRHYLRQRHQTLPPAAAGAGDDASLSPVADAAVAGDDFYAILGVSPLASLREIKLAYYGLMKECHPDLYGDDGGASQAFCTALNDIYDTLADPERRALYDALSGLGDDAINPFMDTSLPATQVFVDELSCIGCRNCCNVCPSTFELEDEWGRARASVQGVDTQDKLQEAIDTCPVSCIHWVTPPQRQLLERTMARLDRVAVWAMMGGGRSAPDVFTEASTAWERRQALMRSQLAEDAARAAAQTAPAGTTWGSGFASMWGFSGPSTGAATGARMYEQAARASRAAGGGGGGGAGSAAGGGREGARVAELAARAAQAAAAWRVAQEAAAAARRRSLSSLSSLSSGEWS